MPERLAFSTLYDNDDVVYGDLLQANSPASLLTHTPAVEAKAIWLASQTADPHEWWSKFLRWQVAAIGHNLTVRGRMLATFYMDPPRHIQSLPAVRCYDGIIIADGKGGVEHCDPYRWCIRPDLGDMAGHIMHDHWRLLHLAVNKLDKAIAEDAIQRAIRHCNYLENKKAALQARQGKR